MQNQIRISGLIVFALLLCHHVAFTQTRYGGIGATIDIDNVSRFPFIVEVMKGMPAEQMNLAPKDFITKINGLSTRNYTIEQVVSNLRGQVGTTCSVTIWRNNVEYPLTFTRAEIVDSRCTIYNAALPAFTDFKWSGSCVDGYASGYGRLRLIKDSNYISSYTGYMKDGKLDGEGIYYYANGNRMLEGTFSNNQLNGNGKKYDSNGNLKFEGYFENDELYGIKDHHDKFRGIARALVDEVFDGGINVTSKIVGFRRSDLNRAVGDDNSIIEIGVTFNGNIITSNYYEVTLRIQTSLSGTSCQLVDANDMAIGYGIAKVGVKLGMLARKLEALRGE